MQSIISTNLVARRHPLAARDQRSGLLVDLGLGGSNLVLEKEISLASLIQMTKMPAKKNTYHREFVEWPGSLNVLKGLFQATQLRLNLALSLLSVLDSLSLKGINSLQLTANIISSGLEVLEVGLDLVDNSLILQDLAVVAEVDGLREFRQDLDLATGVIVTLLERLQGSGGLPAEAKGGGDLGPVNLESGAALLKRTVSGLYS